MQRDYLSLERDAESSGFVGGSASKINIVFGIHVLIFIHSGVYTCRGRKRPRIDIGVDSSTRGGGLNDHRKAQYFSGPLEADHLRVFKERGKL